MRKRAAVLCLAVAASACSDDSVLENVRTRCPDNKNCVSIYLDPVSLCTATVLETGAVVKQCPKALP